MSARGIMACELQDTLESPPPPTAPHPRSLLFFYSYFLFFKHVNFFISLLLYLWLCWVFVSVRGLSLVAASGGHSSSRCAGLPLSRPLLLQSTGSRRAGSVVVAHWPSRSAACGILPDQGSNPCPLHWQADSQPLRHQGSPQEPFKMQVSRSQTQRLRFSKVWMGILEFAQLTNIMMILTQVDQGDPTLRNTAMGVSQKVLDVRISGKKFICALRMFTSRRPCEEERSDGKSILSSRGKKVQPNSKTETVHRYLSPATAICSFTVTIIVLTVTGSQASHPYPAVHFTYLIIGAICCVPGTLQSQ